MLHVHGSSLAWTGSYPRTLARLPRLSILFSFSGLQKAGVVMAASDNHGESKIPDVKTKDRLRRRSHESRVAIWRLFLKSIVY
jgi:hypothetical protein